MAIKIQIGGNSNYIHPAYSLAHRVYQAKDVSHIDTYFEYFRISPESFIFAIDPANNELVGYIISLPLNFKYFERTTMPDFDESDLDPSKVRPFQKGTNNVYLFSIVINQNYYDRVKVLRMLSLAFREQFNIFAKNGIYITQASAVTLSTTGIKLCEGLNMEYVGKNDKGSVFWNCEFYKNLIQKETKDHILKNFVRNRRELEKKKIRKN